MNAVVQFVILSLLFPTILIPLYIITVPFRMRFNSKSIWLGVFDCFAAILTMLFTTLITLWVLRYFKQTPIVWIYLLEFAPVCFKARTISRDEDMASRRNRWAALIGGFLGCAYSIILVLSFARQK